MDLDLALRKDAPPKPTELSIRGAIPTCDNIKAYMKAIESQFVSSDKALSSTLMKKLSNMTLDKVKGVREHIIEIRDIAFKLSSLKVEISESFLVHFILNSLPSEYTPFKISYNTHKENWAINDLLTMCVQEELRLENEFIKTVHFTTNFKGNAKKGNSVLRKKVGSKDKDNWFFCKKKGYMKKDCLKYKKWLKKKGISAPMEAEGK
ncbi:hypothetical protein Tco_1083804 [Tanacetum coccineum]